MRLNAIINVLATAHKTHLICHKQKFATFFIFNLNGQCKHAHSTPMLSATTANVVKIM